MTLRKDERQWLIYDEESVTAVVNAAQIIGWSIAGPQLANHPDIELRALGTFMKKAAEAQTRSMLGLVKGVEPSDAQREGAELAVRVSGHLAGVKADPEALDQLHAALVWLDSRVNGAGLAGPGWYRRLVRGVD